MGVNILVLGGSLSPAAAHAAARHGLTLIPTSPYPDATQLTAAANQAKAAGIIVRLGAVPRDVVMNVPTLKVVAKHGVGVDGIDLEAARERGVHVIVARGANAQSVAEQALALLLAVARSTAWLDRRVRDGHWDKSTYAGLELKGRSIGLIGLGAIGRAFVDLLAPFAMPLGIYDPYLSDAEMPNGARRHTSVAALLEASDIVSLHCPLTPENRGMIDADSFGRMRDDAILINTARGGLVDEAALIAALHERRIWGAGLDTFADEPPSADSPLWTFDRLVVSPHVGANTQAARDRVGISVIEQIATYLSAGHADKGVKADPDLDWQPRTALRGAN